MSTSQKNKKALNSPTYDKTFFDDITDLFLGFRSGHLGKYAYGNYINDDRTSHTSDHWEQVVKKTNNSYSLPNTDSTLLTKACDKLQHFVPEGTNLIDFGVGDTASFYKHILPVVKALESKTYIGVDICQHYLNNLKKIKTSMQDTKIKAINLDFFSRQAHPISPEPAIGVLTCSTIGNIDGSIRRPSLKPELTKTLKNLSHLTKQGWLLVSLDTNQDPITLAQNYKTTAISGFVMSILGRMLNNLPVHNFDPELFSYEPEWHQDSQLFAHIVVATESQDFSIGSLNIHINHGEKLHLLNSHKFSSNFFESCCDKANMDILNVWHHDSPMKLYLLEDRANPFHAAKKNNAHSLLSAFAPCDTGNPLCCKDFAQTANIIGTRTSHHTDRKTRCATGC